MAWYGSRPAGTDDIRDLVIHMPQNWSYLQSALSAQHTFPGSYGTTAGKHILGQVSYLYYGVSADVVTLQSSNLPDGAMAYDMQNWRLLYAVSSVWYGFDGLLHRKGGWMSGNLEIPGAYLDGRDPSVDGARLDLISALAVATGTIIDTEVNDTAYIDLPTKPDDISWERSDCYWIAVQRVVRQIAGTSADSEGRVTTSPTGSADENAYCISIGWK